MVISVDFPSVFLGLNLSLQCQHKSSNIEFPVHYISQNSFFMGSIDPWWPLGCLVAVLNTNS